VTDVPAPVLADPAVPEPAVAAAGWRPARRWLAAAAWVAAALLVLACYWRVSQTEPGDSYGAVFTLQACDMLHGNLLLHGWRLSDVSFYTTELPEYLLVELVLGRSPDVVTVSSGGQVALRPLRVDGHRLAPGQWEAQQSWFGPRRHDATFAALLGTPPSPPVADLRMAFGPPTAIYRVGRYTVLVWPQENLLTRLH
jgi:hypothetical protein